jgi:hypothetical protein
MAQDACLVFFNSRIGCDLEAASRALAGRGMTVEHRSDELVAFFAGQPVFRVRLVSGEAVRKDAAELSVGKSFASRMAECDARFEVLIDDLDAVLDEINSLIDVQSALESLTHGFVYLTWNGELTSCES